MKSLLTIVFAVIYISAVNSFPTQEVKYQPTRLTSPQRVQVVRQYQVPQHRSIEQHNLSGEQSRYRGNVQYQDQYSRTSSWRQKTDRHETHEPVEELWSTKGGSVKSEIYKTRQNFDRPKYVEGVKG